MKHENVRRVLYTFADVQGKADYPFDFEEVMLDSGAFSNSTGKAHITVEAYTLWLQIYLEKYPQIKSYVALDDIKSAKNTARNIDYMVKEGLSPIPCYHYGEPVELLDEYCARFKYVGLGGIASRRLSSEVIRKWWEFVYERHPENLYHIFAVGTLTPFVKYQPYSTDSTAWLSGVMFGNLLCDRNGLPSSIPDFSRGGGYKLYFTLDEICYNNIRAMLEWEKMDWVKNLPSNITDPNKPVNMFDLVGGQ